MHEHHINKGKTDMKRMLNEAEVISAKTSIKPFVCYMTDDKKVLKRWINDISEMVDSSYASEGGYRGDSSLRSLLKNADRAKLVFGDDEKLLAVSLYRTDLGGYKRFCSASQVHASRKIDAVQTIIKDDIKPYDNWYWVEASGMIEKLFKKNGGNPIPNHLAAEFLRIDPSKLNLLEDGVHYERAVGPAHAVLAKMIFGFKDKEAARKACAAVANYDDFKLNVNKLLEDDNELDIACQVIRQIFELHDEWGCNEMLPEWHEQMKKAVAKVKSENSARRQKMLDGVLARAAKCTSEMPKLVVRRLSLAD